MWSNNLFCYRIKRNGSDSQRVSHVGGKWYCFREMSLPWCGSGDSLAGISGVAATDQLLGQKGGVTLTFC